MRSKDRYSVSKFKIQEKDRHCFGSTNVSLICRWQLIDDNIVAFRRLNMNRSTKVLITHKLELSSDIKHLGITGNSNNTFIESKG